MLSMICKAALIGLFAFLVALVALAMVRPSGQPQQQNYDYSAQQQPNTSGSENRIPETGWNAFWKAVWREPINIFTLALVFATLLLGLIAIFQSYILLSTDRTTERAANAAKQAADTASDALIASTRAWIAPTFAKLTTPLENGPPISIQVHIINTGREPALYGTRHFNHYLIPYIEPSNVPGEHDLGPNTACDNLVPSDKSGIVVYPTNVTNFWVPYEIPDTPEDRNIIGAALAHRNSLVIEGCFAYRTGGKAHKSAFRFFLRDVPNQPSLQWNLNAMTTGNYAD
jgi:hypothetical protein